MPPRGPAGSADPVPAVDPIFPVVLKSAGVARAQSRMVCTSQSDASRNDVIQFVAENQGRSSFKFLHSCLQRYRLHAKLRHKHKNKTISRHIDQRQSVIVLSNRSANAHSRSNSRSSSMLAIKPLCQRPHIRQSGFDFIATTLYLFLFQRAAPGRTHPAFRQPRLRRHTG